MRPHLGVEVNPNHGLWAFFRRKEQDGKVSYETVEPMDVVEDKSGTSQHTLHLRRVFKLGLVNRRSGMDSGGVEAEELQGPAHAVVCRLAGAEPARDAAGRGPEAWGERAGSWAVGQGVQGMYSSRSPCPTFPLGYYVLFGAHVFMLCSTIADDVAASVQCRKTMARIKYVINERRLAYEGALKIHNEKREQLLQLDEEERAKEVAKAAEAARREEKAKRRQGGVENVASKSLFETIPEAVPQTA